MEFLDDWKQLLVFETAVVSQALFLVRRITQLKLKTAKLKLSSNTWLPFTCKAISRHSSFRKVFSCILKNKVL
jgi:hypothetical protein